MVALLGHCTVLDGVRPVLASADAVTILNVEPGGKIPCSARSKPPGRSTTASTRPVVAEIATMSTGFFVWADDTASEAAICTDRSRLVFTGVPGLAAKCWAIASTCFPGPRIRIVSEGRPA